MSAIALVTPIVRDGDMVASFSLWLQWVSGPPHTTFTLFPVGGFVFAGGAIGALIAVARASLE